MKCRVAPLWLMRRLLRQLLCLVGGCLGCTQVLMRHATSLLPWRLSNSFLQLGLHLTARLRRTRDARSPRPRASSPTSPQRRENRFELDYKLDTRRFELDGRDRDRDREREHGFEMSQVGGDDIESRSAAEPISPIATSTPEAFAFLGAPKLHGATSDPPSVLTSSQLMHLRHELPMRLRLCEWSLLYSSEQHGCSLRTFYHRAERAGPTLLVVLDAQGHIFGGFASESWRTSRRYFGTGETFLFKVHPDFATFRWTRVNSLFLFGAPECIAFGGGSQGSAAGLFLDSSFEYGSSYLCRTFANEPLAGSPDFKCIKVEVWGFNSFE